MVDRFFMCSINFQGIIPIHILSKSFSVSTYLNVLFVKLFNATLRGVASLFLFVACELRIDELKLLAL